MTRSVAIKLTAGVGAVMLSTVGLAYAGVDLPGVAAEQAFEAIGVHLPNQGERPPEGAGNDVSDFASNPDVKKDCRFGQAVADLADDSSEDSRRDDAQTSDPCDQAEAGKATGDEKSAEGRAKAEQARADGRARGRHASSAGRSKAEQATSEGASVGASTAGEASGAKSTTSRETGDSASQSGQSNNPSSGSDSGPETGDSASESGQSNNPTDSGRP